MNECYNCGHDIEDHVLLKCHPTAGYETGYNKDINMVYTIRIKKMVGASCLQCGHSSHNHGGPNGCQYQNCKCGNTA